MVRWENWSRSAGAEPKRIAYPTTEEQIVALVQETSANGGKIRMVGSGHSFTPLVPTHDLLLSLDAYQGVIHADTETQRVTVKAGTRIKTLGGMLHHLGLAQPNLGDIDVQSIAGAISTGTHGTGATFGNIATQVVALRLVTADGTVIDCSEHENRDVFKAAQISLGTLGVITQVTLQCVPAFNLHYTWQKQTLDHVLDNVEDYKRNNRNFEFFWIPHTNTTLVKTFNVTDQPAGDKNRLRQFNEVVVENGVLWLLSEIARRFPARSKRIAKLMAALVSGGEDVSASHETFATVRAVKFQEMEYNIPAEHVVDCLREIQSAFFQHQFQVHFPIECRFAAADDIPLSPAYGRDSAYIAVHVYKDMPREAFFERVERIFKKYDGRPHWGKLHARSSEELAALYPLWGDFHAVRDRLDPDGVFLNGYLSRLFGVGETAAV